MPVMTVTPELDVSCPKDQLKCCALMKEHEEIHILEMMISF